VLRQADVAQFARGLFGEKRGSEVERLLPAFANAGIAQRRSCVPLEWYGQSHGWAEKNRLYIENATALAEEAAEKCLGQADMGVDQVDVILTVSSSGIATPSLDALLAERMGFRRDVQRLPVFGLGCAGGVLGLSRGGAMAQAGATVLVVVVELCGLTFRSRDEAKSNIIATALFGDGAAAALLTRKGDGMRLAAWGEHTWPDSLDVMGWHIEDDGFGVLFSRDIPNLVRSDLRAAAEQFLGREGLTLDGLAGMVCHPGGAKVLDALEAAFGLPPGGMAEARAVLREHGNMSAVTVLFVLERMLANGMRGRHLMSALGPGFTAAFLLLDDT
jgi:alkylresorcinol/alkylpyrone synthase